MIELTGWQLVSLMLVSMLLGGEMTAIAIVYFEVMRKLWSFLH